MIDWMSADRLVAIAAVASVLVTVGALAQGRRALASSREATSAAQESATAARLSAEAAQVAAEAAIKAADGTLALVDIERDRRDAEALAERAVTWTCLESRVQFENQRAIRARNGGPGAAEVTEVHVLDEAHRSLTAQLREAVVGEPLPRDVYPHEEFTVAFRLPTEHLRFRRVLEIRWRDSAGDEQVSRVPAPATSD